MSETRCYWTKDDNGDPFLIPQCYGAAIHPEGCTCSVPGSRIELAENARDALGEEVQRLREKLLHGNERYLLLLDENRRLRAKLSGGA